MRVFDQVDALTIDRREMHLWLLAIIVILVMGVGMALLMYPTAFSNPVILTGVTLRKAFFGFCTLTALLAGYLMDRRWVIGQLRRRLFEEQARNIAIRHQASSELLETLPGFSHFQDRLSMEYRRANTTHQPLSMLIVSLSPSRLLSDQREMDVAYGDAAKALVRRLRREDSIYLFRPGVFGIVVPGTTGNEAYQVSDRLAEGLRDASGASDRFTFDLRVVNYPEHTNTAREMEEFARSFLPEEEAATRAD